MSENTQGVLYRNVKWLQHNGKLLTVNYRGSVDFGGVSHRTLKIPIRIYSGQDSTVYRQEWMVDNLNLALGNDSYGNPRDIDWSSLSADDKICVVSGNGSVTSRKALSEGTSRPDGWWIDRFEPPNIFDDEHDVLRKNSARSVLINGQRYYNDAAIEVIDEMVKGTGWRIPRPDEYLQVMNYFEDLKRMYNTVDNREKPDEYHPDPVEDPSKIVYYCPQFEMNPGMLIHEKVSGTIDVQTRVVFHADPEHGGTLTFAMRSGEGDNSIVNYNPSDSVSPTTSLPEQWGWGIYGSFSGKQSSNKTMSVLGNITPDTNFITSGFGALPTRGIANMEVRFDADLHPRKVRLVLLPSYGDGVPMDPTIVPPVMKIGFAYRSTSLAPYFYPIRLVRLNNFNL